MSSWLLVVAAWLTVPASRAQPCPREVDVLFVLDHSGSISDNDEGPIGNWITITDMVANVVRATERFPGIRYAAISYGSKAEIEFNLDRYTGTRELVIAFRSIRDSGGNTNTTGALRLSRTGVWSSLANRPTAFDVLVLITDGVPSQRYEADGVIPEADRVKALGVRLIGIGVTTAVNAELMRRIVSQPVSQNYFGLSSFTQLSSIVESLATCITGTTFSVTTTPTTTPSTTTPSTTTPSTTTSSTTTATTTPTSTTTPPTTTPRTTLHGPLPDITTTPKPPTPTPGPAECRHRADIVILLDVSGGRMDFAQFKLVRQFLVEMLTQLRAVIESGAVRVGMVRYADRVVHQFHLRTYLNNFSGMIDSVRNTEYIGGGTNTGLGSSILYTSTVLLQIWLCFVY